MTFYQIFLPIATLLYLLLVFVLRSVILWKQTGVNPFVFGNTGKAHDYIGRVYKLMVLGTWVSIGIYSFYLPWYSYLVPIQYLEIDWLKTIGLILLVISFLWTSIAQYQMSKSWRIGIDYNEKTELISNGLFKYSRNPIFLGVLISYLGTFLIIPNILSFSILHVTFVTIQTQVRLEEEYLESVQGQDYLGYKLQVRRWI
ncbi:Protein-S-isoprenylcysteine O-methyltransferase Ste14 [Ekhidna lutea]|uniref:Protein-S-isoprenylcysteine O-methyltransferase Ste14 n=1 Tax=Ekhidna lutea TaxID=447679 RepID=A0A239GWI3_EKHLU|nr:isoprenylcysteine carboxylmethyltransferase family protein [Ekhidna lutea]SNS73225.1 Protein-S-isoprenylcysteine O-methyltransferase Ste14 [Ekhidna lutea]